MKKVILTTGVLITASILMYAAMATWVFNTKSFAIEEAAAADTSSLIDLRNYEIVELTTSVTGIDSVKLKVYVDGYWNGKYDLNVYNDSLIIDNGTGDYTEGYLLRGYGVNNIKGYELIRVRVNVSSGQVDDSSSAMSYSMRVTGK
jgi:hypothetical protein